MATLQQLRSLFPTGKSDEDVMSMAAKEFGMNPVDIANEVGYDAGNGGLTSKRIGSAVDSYQSNWYGLGGAAARAVGMPGVGKWMDEGRDDNKMQSDIAAQRAKALGGVDDWRDITGAGTAANFAGGLLAQSLPYLAEAPVGGLVARGLMTGTRAALAGAQTVEAASAARKALNTGSLVGGAAASYPSAVGDILSNQREENGGENLGMAAAGGVPYAAMNAFGVEGMLARGVRPRDLLQGGTLARVGKAAGVTALTEGASETGQEMVNQGFGRMAVNPDQTMFNPEANKRYLDSFVGGAVLGGVMGGAGGLRGPESVKPIADDTPVDLLNPEPQGDPQRLGYSPLAGTPIIFPDGTVTLNGEQELNNRYPDTPFPGGPEQRPDLPETLYGVPGGGVVADPQNQTLLNADFSQDPGAELARQQWLDKRAAEAAKVQAQQQQAQEIQQAQQAQAENLSRVNTALGVSSPKVTQSHTLFQELEALRDLGAENGGITPAQFTDNAAKLAGDKPLDAPGVRKFIRDVVKAQQPVVSKPPTAAEVAQQADTDNAPKAAPAVVAPAPTATESVAPTRAPVAGVLEKIVADVAPSNELAVQENKAPAVMSAPKADVGAMADALVTKLGLDPKKVVMVGRKDRPKSMTAREFAIKLLSNPEDAGTPAKVKQAEMDRTVVLAAMGRDADGDMVSSPLSLDQVALLRSRLEGGKPVTREAVRQTLAKFGINEDLINMMVGGDMGSAITQSELENPDIGASGARSALGMNDLGTGEDNTSKGATGFRVARSLSDATSDALMDPGNSMAAAKPGEAAPRLTYGDRQKLSAEAKALAKQEKLALDNAAVDQYLAPPKQEAPEVEANRLATAAATKAAPAPRLTVSSGEITETEADEAYVNQRGVEKEIKALEVAWNKNLDDGDVAFSDMPLELQLEVYKVSKDEANLLISARQRRELFIGIQQDANNGTRTNNTGIQGPNALTQIAGPSEVRGGDGTDSGDAQSAGDPAPGRRDTPALPGQAQSGEVENVVAKEAPAPKGREVTAAEMALIEWKAGNLAMPQTRKLEKAYNAETGTADFNQQLKADVEAFLNGGLSAVSKPEIASIVKDMAPEVAAVPLNGDVQFSKAKKGEGSKAAELESDLKKFMRVGAFGNKVTVVQSMADLPAGIQRSVNPTADTQGFVVGNKAYLIADNIAPGKGRAVFLHEIGAHLGLENLMGKEQYAALVSKVKQWAAKADGSQESKLAQAAQQRVADAGTDAAQADSELVAYFIEETVDAGIDPTATKGDTEFGRWFRTIWAAFKTAMHKLGVNPDKLTAQDVVDMAYGAAKLELSAPVEPGAAATDTPEAVLRFYRQTERTGKELNDGSGIDGNVTTYTGPGTERVTWGTDSKIGGFGPIRSIAAYAQQPLVSGDVRRSGGGTPSTEAGSMGVYFFSPESEALAKKHGEKSSFFFLHANVYRDTQTGPWSVLLNTPPVDGKVFAELKAQGLVEEALDPRTGQPTGYGRVTGVTDTQRNELLSEARRRLTRVMGGEVPALKWVRTTGRHIGTHSELSPERVKAKFSKAAKPQTMQQFSDKLPGRVADLWDSFKTTVDEVSVKAMFTQDLIDLASKVLPSAAKYMRAMSDIQIERGRAERVVADVVEDFRALPAHERGMGDKSVNAFIKKSTMTGKWAFAPDWVPGAKVDPDLKADFEAALSPKAQELVKRVFRRGHESLVEMQTAAIANADSEYNALIAEAQRAGDTKEVASLTSAKAKSLKDFQGLLAIHKGTPYAPLKRFGNYVVMAVSQAYKTASESGDAKAMQEMQRNGDHYHIEFTDTNREARARARELESSFPGGFVGKMEKGDDGLMMGGRDMLGAFGRLRKVMADSVVDNPNVDKATGKRIDDMMRQLYLTLLSETSARKGEIHRKNVAGANNDMLRAFATQGRATAHFIAGLKTSGKVDDHLAGMRTETKALNSGREERTRYYNEIVRRHSLGLEYKPSPMIDQMMAGTSAMMLLTNPSYHLMNALQPGMMTIPLLAGRHGYAKSWAALTRAYSELGPILKAREFTEKSYAALPADVRQAIEDLANMGKIDIMMDADLGRVESASDNAVKRPFVVASEWLKGISQDVESMNRLSSAIAAYRMEKGQPGATHQSAVDYAAKVIYETHGDYSGFNAPRFMRSGVGRLATQFKKFQLIQLSMFVRLANRSWRNDPSMTPAQNAEAKVAARYALTYTLSHLLAMGGVMGLPGFAAIAWVVGKVWPGDDEPDDPEATLRRAIGNEALADFLLQGAPSSMGVNVSGRIGAGGMLSVLPYTDVEFSRKSYPEMVTAAMGPFIGGVLPRAIGGVELMTKGELAKGTEALLPNGMGNALKSVRFGVDGVSKGNGDTLMSANDLNALDILGQAFGLPTTKITDRTTENSSQYKAEQFYKDRTGELKQRYTKAAKSNDADTMRDLRVEWTNTQAARRDLGFKPSPLSDLLKSPQEQRKREAATQGGVQFNKGNKGFVEALQ